MKYYKSKKSEIDDKLEAMEEQNRLIEELN